MAVTDWPPLVRGSARTRGWSIRRSLSGSRRCRCSRWAVAHRRRRARAVGRRMLVLLESLPLVARRRFPVAVLAVTFGATFGHVLLAPQGASVSEGFGSLVALYTVAERRDRTHVGAGRRLDGRHVRHPDRGPGWPARGLAGADPDRRSASCLAWALGDLARTRGLFGEVMEDRARRLESEREERARMAVVAERERIARELHDIVAHHVSVIVIQAGAALRAIDRRPEAARTAIEAVERTSREALADMRRMLGILGDGAPTRRGRPGADARARPARPARRGGPRRRPAGRAVGPGRAPPARRRGRAVGLPHRPGGADQRAQARARCARADRPALPAAQPRDRGRRRGRQRAGATSAIRSTRAAA